mmetsp:Transcript_1676/g.2716  ORF Transcript_1676/g.2716 Transcript_1676/m.2716 type:complete len:114 (+) Transcript_1676:40-381(+)
MFYMQSFLITPLDSCFTSQFTINSYNTNSRHQQSHVASTQTPINACQRLADADAISFHLGFQLPKFIHDKVLAVVVAVLAALRPKRVPASQFLPPALVTATTLAVDAPNPKME